jgi:hypothetical protein
MTVLISFNGMYVGDTADVEYTERVMAWESMGLVTTAPVAPQPKRERRGKSQARPGSAEPSVAGGKTLGAGDSGPSGDEQGEGFGAGGYGAAEG